MSDIAPQTEGKLTVRLPATLLELVDTAAKERGLGRSEFVREALATQAREVLGEAPAPTLYSLLEGDGVLGRFEGPVGLSTESREQLRARIKAHSMPTAEPSGVSAE